MRTKTVMPVLMENELFTPAPTLTPSFPALLNRAAPNPTRPGTRVAVPMKEPLFPPTASTAGVEPLLASSKDQ